MHVAKGWLSLGLLLATPVVSVAAFAPVAVASEVWSLVFEGRITDLTAQTQPSGATLSMADLAAFLGRLGGVRLESRPDRGLVVIDGRHGTGTIAPIKGFTSPNLTVIVNDTQLSVAASLDKGVPYIGVGSFSAILDALGLNVVVDDATGLVAVARRPGGEGGGGSGGATGEGSTAQGSTGMPGAGFQQAVLDGASSALSVLSPGAGSAVCSAMDTLRQAWHDTEPSAREKQTFQELAQKLQAAKDGQGEATLEDAQALDKALAAFRKKVDRRAAATRAWQATAETARVKTLGNDFLTSYVQIMDLMGGLTADMVAGKTRSQEELDAAAQQARELERLIRSQGAAFDAEVKRVRTGYGCGPATLGMPGS